MTIKARKPISHIIMYTKLVYKDDTVILFLRCWKAHDINLLKMYVKWLSVVGKSNRNREISYAKIARCRPLGLAAVGLVSCPIFPAGHETTLGRSCAAYFRTSSFTHVISIWERPIYEQLFLEGHV